MTTRTVDGNFRVVDGMLVIPEGLEAVRQLAVQHLLFILGESFRSPDEGTPYFARILGTFQDPALSAQAVAGELESAITEITGVRIVSFTVNPDNRGMKLTLRISSIFGDMEVSV